MLLVFFSSFSSLWKCFFEMLFILFVFCQFFARCCLSNFFSLFSAFFLWIINNFNCSSQSQCRKYLAHLHYMRLKKAAITTQCAWRGRVARKELRKLKMVTISFFFLCFVFSFLFLTFYATILSWDGTLLTIFWKKFSRGLEGTYNSVMHVMCFDTSPLCLSFGLNFVLHISDLHILSKAISAYSYFVIGYFMYD